MNIGLTLFIVLVGMGLTVQAAVNARLREAIGQPELAALISFGIGAIGLLLILLTGLTGKIKPFNMADVPWWAWTGGLLGALYVTTAVIAVPRIGTAVLICAAVCGQLIASLMVDSFGLMGAPKVPLSLWRIVGALLLAGGVFLIQKK